VPVEVRRAAMGGGATWGGRGFGVCAVLRRWGLSGPRGFPCG
jgi:hypothetical protein